MSSNKRRFADAIAAAQAAKTQSEARLAAAHAALAEALSQLAIAQNEVLLLSSTNIDIAAEGNTAPGVVSGSTAFMDIVAEAHTAPGVGSGSTAPMDIVEEDHTGRGAGPAPRDTQSGLFTGASGESQTPLLKGHCKFCQQNFEHPSFVAYFCDEPGMPFAKLTEPVVQKVNVCVFGTCHLTAPRAG